ncbi:NDP-sugar synthase [Candidatus Bathyarchaeota archaeon]|nr:NDP-sugar synthase [Candidatus Bathyarchaeota archaeon]
MKALILAGGFGTRLRPISCTRPKTLLPIVNKPLLERVLQRLEKTGIKEAILAVNGLTEFYIKKYTIEKYGLDIKYSIDPPKKPLGTGGPIKKAETLIGKSGPFLVLNGDIFTDLEYKEIIEFHKKKQAIATIALYEVDDPSRYGVAEILDNNRIKQFIEKPKKDEAPSNLINAGIYVLDPKIFNYIPKDKPISMEREIFPKLIKEKNLFGLTMQGLWMDIGKPAGYLQANNKLLKTYHKKNKIIIQNSEIKTPVAIDSDVKIGLGTVIGPYVAIGKNTIIGNNVKINNSVILPDVTIKEEATIKGAIIGEGAVIGKNVKVNNDCVIGDYVEIEDNILICEGRAVCPGTKITGNILNSI